MAIKNSPIQTLGKVNTDPLPIIVGGLAAGERMSFSSSRLISQHLKRGIKVDKILGRLQPKNPPPSSAAYDKRYTKQFLCSSILYKYRNVEEI